MYVPTLPYCARYSRLEMQINTIPKLPTVQYFEQQINYILMLKEYVKAIPTIQEAIKNATSALLREVAVVKLSCKCQ